MSEYAAMIRGSDTWTEHRDINEVMLATSLAPDGFLVLLLPDKNYPGD